MLKITIPKVEGFNEDTNEFVTLFQETNLQLEHSLVSISKWESKWHIPYLSKSHKKTYEQTIDYIRCMTLTQNVNPDIFYYLDSKIIKEIQDYIGDPMTATTFSEETSKKSKENITSEEIYYLMFSYNIPMECQKWHLNKLLTLIKVFSIKNEPQKKMSNNEIIARNRALNKARRAKLHSRG